MIIIQEIKDSILKSIETIVNQKIQTLYFDKTITGRISECLGDNKYRVILNGGEHVFPSSNDYIYLVHDIVHITLPQNDMNSAYIAGKKR